MTTELQYAFREDGPTGLQDPRKQLLLHPYIHNESWWLDEFMYDRGQTDDVGADYTPDDLGSYWSSQYITQIIYE